MTLLTISIGVPDLDEWVTDGEIRKFDRTSTKKAAVGLDISELNRIKNNQLVKDSSNQNLPFSKKSEASPLDE